MPEGALVKWSLSPAYDALSRNLERALTPADIAAMRWEEVEAEPPVEGRNELVLAISELGGGWGFVCRVTPLTAGGPEEHHGAGRDVQHAQHAGDRSQHDPADREREGEGRGIDRGWPQHHSTVAERNTASDDEEPHDAEAKRHGDTLHAGRLLR